MRIEDLRLLIREEMREVMREELRQILTEAVQIASTPTQQPVQPRHQFTTPDWVSELKVADSPAPIQSEAKAPAPSVKMKKNPLDLLKETARGMTGADLQNFM